MQICAVTHFSFDQCRKLGWKKNLYLNLNSVSWPIPHVKFCEILAITATFEWLETKINWAIEWEASCHNSFLPSFFFSLSAQKYPAEWWENHFCHYAHVYSALWVTPFSLLVDKCRNIWFHGGIISVRQGKCGSVSICSHNYYMQKEISLVIQLTDWLLNNNYCRYTPM